MLDEVRARNAGAGPQGSVGVVVGATIGDTGEDLAINGPLLVPGLGAQGGQASDLKRIFAGCGPNVLPSVSREILGAGPDQQGLIDASRRAADDYRAALADLA